MLLMLLVPCKYGNSGLGDNLRALGLGLALEPRGESGKCCRCIMRSVLLRFLGAGEMGLVMEDLASAVEAVLVGLAIFFILKFELCVNLLMIVLPLVDVDVLPLERSRLR